jgi:hypothetical protein
VLPHDHDGIVRDDGVIRRISPLHVVYDPKIGGKKVSTMAFEPSSEVNGGLSVDLQRQIEDAGLVALDYVSEPPWLGSIRFTAGTLRDEGFLVGYDPLPENPHHGEVWGSFTKSKKKQLLRLATWFAAMDGVTLA